MKYDLFIAHASEDKDFVARPLAGGLIEAGLKVWYDELSLKLGDSLRGSIDQGLANSRFGAVLLSQSFFAKNWPQAELNGLFAREMSGENVILPIWHDIDRDYLVKVSPIISDRVATKTALGLDRVIEDILDIVEPDRAHKTRNKQTIVARPKSLRLYVGQFAVKTPIAICNPGRIPLYSVVLKLTVSPEGVDSSSVLIEPDSKSTALRATAGPVETSADIIRLNCIDSLGREAVFLQIHTIFPRDCREVVVAGTSPKESGLSVEITHVGHSPPEVLQQSGQAFVALKVTEDIQLKSIAVALRRTS